MTVKPWKDYLKSKQFWKYCLLVVFLIVGVPVIINELYKLNRGYLTVWDGSDVLSYYGTILGAMETIFALIGTIHFTRRQIVYERYIRCETEKWERIESVFRTAITLAQPLTLYSIYMSNLSQQSVEGCAEMKKHMYDLWGTIDNIHGIVEDRDEPQIRGLLQELKKLAQKEDDISGQYFDLLMAFQVFRGSGDEESSGMKMALLLSQQQSVSDAVEQLHKKDYQLLLKLKKQCFGNIYGAVEEEAKHILHGES